MGVRVVFLGPLADLEGAGEREMPAPLDWSTLLANVSDAVSARLLESRVNIACAGIVLADKAALDARDGDEVALLPPVSGG